MVVMGYYVFLIHHNNKIFLYILCNLQWTKLCENHLNRLCIKINCLFSPDVKSYGSYWIELQNLECLLLHSLL